MTEIARGTIKIDLDDEAALAQLRAIDAEFERTMNDIDRSKATAKIDADLAPLKDKIANAKRELKQLDGQQADPALKLDDKEFQKTRRKIQAELKRLEGEKATIEIEVKGDEQALKRMQAVEDAKVKQMQAEARRQEKLAKLERQAEARRMAGINQESKRRNALNRQRERDENAALRRMEAADRRREQAARAAERDEKARLAAIEKEAKRRASLNAQRQREFDQAHTAALRMNAQMDKEQQRLPKMQRQYLELGRTLETLKRQRRRAFGDRLELTRIDLREKEVIAKMRMLHSTLERIGGTIDIEVALHPGRSFGRDLRRKLIDNRALAGNWARESTSAGVIVADHFARGFFSGVKRRMSKQAIAGAATRSIGRIGDVLQGLSNMTVRIGPFTATLRKLGIALAVLGPTILDLVGAFSSLIGVLGAGLAGASVVGLGAVAGLGLGFLGLGLSMRNTTQDVGRVRLQINALEKAQDKYGKTSGKAIKEQRRLNTMLKNVSPLAAATAVGIERFYKNWDAHTVQTRSNLGKVAQAGFSTLDKVTPAWAKQTNKMSSVLRDKLGGAFDFVAGRGQARIFGPSGILGNFNTALPRLMNGLGKVGEAFVNLGAEGSRHLGRAFSSFNRLGSSLLKFTRRDTFGDTIQRWVDTAAELGHWFTALGRLSTSFFSAGLGAGRNFTRTMTNAFNSWDRFLRSAEGRNKTAQWFDQSVKGATALWNALKPIATTFFSWAANLSPVFTQFLAGAAAIGQAVAALIKLVGLQGPLGTLAATLGALWAVGKISAATRAVLGFSSALLGLKTAQSAVARGGAASSAAVVGAGAAARGASGGGGTGGAPIIVPRTGPGGAPKPRITAGAYARYGTGAFGDARAQQAAIGGTAALAANTGRLAKAGLAAKSALSGLSGVIGFSNPYVGGAILAAAGLYAAYKILSKNAKNAKQAIKDAGQASEGAAASYRDNTTSLADVSTSHKQAAIDVRTAKRELEGAKKGTDDYKQAQLNLQYAQRQLLITGDAVKKQNLDRQKATDVQVQSEQKRLASFDKLTASQRKVAENQQKNAAYYSDQAAATAKLNDLDQRRAALVDKVNAALNRQAATSANTARATAGLTPILGAAEQKLGSLARLSKGTALKVALKFDKPQDVGKVAASAAASLKAGVPNRIVMRIVANSSNADQAVHRLQNARITEKKMQIIEQGGIGALRTLQQIAGRKLTDKEFRTVMSGGDGAMQVLRKILGVKLGDKIQRILETGSSTVAGALRKVLGLAAAVDRPHSTTITANASGAFGPINSVLGALSRIPASKTTTITTRFVNIGGKGKPNVNASGRGPGGGGELSYVGEGRNFKGAPEIIANQRTGAVSVAKEPTLMRLSPDDYVIPTEPRYRAKGKELFGEFAKGMGIPMYRSSKRPKLPKLISSKAADAGNLKEVKAYDAIQQEEEDKNKEISVAERKVKEPSTYLKPNGLDAAGNQLYTLNESAIATYDSQLAAVEKKEVELIGDSSSGVGGIMGRLKKAATVALSALGKYREDRKKNITELNKAKDRAQGPASSKRDTDTKKAAKKVISDANSEITRQKTMYDSSINVTKEIGDDQRDADISRIPNYQLDLQDIRDTRSTLRSAAQAESDAAAPEAAKAKAPDAPEPGVGEAGGPTVGEDRVGRLETEKALASIGQGIGGAAPRAMSAIIDDLIGANQARLDEGSAMLRDSTTSNDAEAYSIIQGAASSIQSLKDEISALNETNSQTAAGVIAQQSAFGTAMLDLYRNNANNYSSTAASMAVAAAIRPSTSFDTAGDSSTPGSGVKKGGVSAAGGVVINQTFPAQPDPLTWAKATQFELNAAL